MDEENSLKERFSGYVRKPFSKRELFDELAEFLPRHANAGVRAGRLGRKPTRRFRRWTNGPAPKELLSQLRQLLVEPWPSIRDSVAVNESKIFAQRARRSWASAGNASRWSTTRKPCCTTRRIMP